MTKPSRSLSKGRLARAGLVVARRERAHGGEAADAHRGDGRLGSAGDHRVGVAAPDDLERLADGVRRGGAGGRCREVGALGAEPDRHLPGGEVDDGRGDEERRDLARAALEQRLVLALDGPRSPPMPDAMNTPTRAAFSGTMTSPASAAAALRRRDGVVDEGVHLLDVLLVHVLQRVEALDLGGDPGGERRGVEPGDRARRRCARRTSPSQVASVPTPSADTNPMPVTTTRLFTRPPDTRRRNP